MTHINIYVLVLVCIDINSVLNIQFSLYKLNQTSSLSFDNNTINTLESFMQFDESVVKGNLRTIKMCIGEPQQCFNMLYDLASHITWVGSSQTFPKLSKIFNPSQSRTYTLLSKELYMNDFNGILIQDYIHFPSDNMTNAKEPFSLFLINEIKNEALPYDGVLGLNREYSSNSIRIEKSQWIEAKNKYSLINYLIKNTLITQPIFAHKMNKNQQGVLYIGETGSTDVSYPTCSSKSKGGFQDSFYSYYWHCSSTNIYDSTNDKIIIKELQNNDIEIVFDSGLDSIVGPKSEMRNIFIHLENFAIKSSCKRKPVNDLGIALQCIDLNISSVPHLSFEIASKINITFTGEDLFERETQNEDGHPAWISKLILNNHLTTSIVFGMFALEKYHMVFNTVDYTIGFISLDQSLAIDTIAAIKDRLKTIMLCFIIFMLGLLLLEIVFVIKNRKNIFNKGKYV